MATITHTVVKNENLTVIAKKYGTTVDAIVQLNNIPNRNLIYVGQVLYISGKPSSAETGGTSGGTTSSPSVASTAPASTVDIWAFGEQSNADRVIYIAWGWSSANTKEFKVEWDYNTGDPAWFSGSRETVSVNDLFESTYTAPENAINVRVRIKPISDTYKSGDNEVSYWTANWCAYKSIATPKKEDPYVLPTLSAPTVEVDGYKMTCRIDNISESDVKYTGDDIYVEFEILKNDVQSVYLGLTKVVYWSAAYTHWIDPGFKYKARARLKQGALYGAWSPFSGNKSSIPYAPTSEPVCRATSSTSINVSWSGVESATTYDVEYTTNRDNFNSSNGTTVLSDLTTTYCNVTGLESGNRYYFRVRACNTEGKSSWGLVGSVIIGTKPGSPSTWSSTTTAISGEELILYWIHNSEDASIEVRAEVEIYFNETKTTYTVENPNKDEDEVRTRSYTVSTSALVDGAEIKWRVRTAGITEEYGDWSVQRTVNVYAPPTLEVLLLDSNDKPISTLNAFPLRIKGTAGPQNQTPISFHVSIVATDSYETVDELGNFKMVVAGDSVFSKYYDISHNLDVSIMPNDVDLQANVMYEIHCIVAMDTGLTAEKVYTFNVDWVESYVKPNAEIIFDKEKIVTHIRPFCEYYPYIYYQVDYVDQTYVRTDTKIEEIEGISVDNAFTADGDVVYAGFLDNVLTHFCIRQSEEPVPIPDITFAVYRREFNGTFTEIISGLSSDNNSFVTDPHPALDFARYRIVAQSNLTGSISFTDLPGYHINVKSIIIQWNEAWSNYDVTNEGAILDPAWAGSMIKLPYNIDISDSNSSDVSLINYIGRAHPVSYYGTQVGSTSTWNVVIPRKDVETLYNLRRLSTWMGDVYVREPSGSGYWANISVSFSQTHKEVTIPVTINITRVDGGM